MTGFYINLLNTENIKVKSINAIVYSDREPVEKRIDEGIHVYFQDVLKPGDRYSVYISIEYDDIYTGETGLYDSGIIGGIVGNPF